MLVKYCLVIIYLIIDIKIITERMTNNCGQCEDLTLDLIHIAPVNLIMRLFGLLQCYVVSDLLLFVVKSTTRRQTKMHFRLSNLQLTSAILQIQDIYFLNLTQYMIITNVFHWTILAYMRFI